MRTTVLVKKKFSRALTAPHNLSRVHFPYHVRSWYDWLVYIASHTTICPTVSPVGAAGGHVKLWHIGHLLWRKLNKRCANGDWGWQVMECVCVFVCVWGGVALQAVVVVWKQELMQVFHWVSGGAGAGVLCPLWVRGKPELCGARQAWGESCMRESVGVFYEYRCCYLQKNNRWAPLLKHRGRSLVALGQRIPDESSIAPLGQRIPEGTLCIGNRWLGVLPLQWFRSRGECLLNYNNGTIDLAEFKISCFVTTRRPP